ncbi:sugar ABC transporter permease [Rhizobium sp. NZLR3b]|uniref:carbohydrate ABC transporter permease n=1 Tax=Rhizobium sp. NZLR3b TaxID=2731101 RepID=UPI001C83004E|nr:sugar ABC transporter permease [Rhizobium sp. NZLR3b]MBX5193667.1 sugar ABC transporter permease [Rhizobium sp. NZLR3b]
MSLQSAPLGPSVRTRPLMAPAVIPLFLWMIVPLAMTIYFSSMRYTLLDAGSTSFIGFGNYVYFGTDPAFWTSIVNTLFLVGGVLIASLAIGVGLAIVFYETFPGHAVARLLVITPFFVMPTVAALVWKNLLMHPVNGLFAYFARLLGLPAIDWFASMPLTAIGIIVTWQWAPFATLILLTAIQSLDREQIEAARMDGARGLTLFFHITLPHLARAIGVVAMIETIFLLSVFAEILVTTNGGPGDATTTLPYLIYKTALLDFNVGMASAGGIFAVVLANVVGFFLIRTISRNLDV